MSNNIPTIQQLMEKAKKTIDCTMYFFKEKNVEQKKPNMNLHSIIFNSNVSKQKKFNYNLVQDIVNSNSPLIYIDNDYSDENFNDFIKIIKQNSKDDDISIISFRDSVQSTNNISKLDEFKNLLSNDLIRNYQSLIELSEILNNKFLYIVMPKIDNLNDEKKNSIITANLISFLKNHLAFSLSLNPNNLSSEEIKNRKLDLIKEQKFVIFNNFKFSNFHFNDISVLMRQRRRLKYSFIFDINKESNFSDENFNKDYLFSNFFNKIFLDNNLIFLDDDLNKISINDDEGLISSNDFSGKFKI